MHQRAAKADQLPRGVVRRGSEAAAPRRWTPESNRSIPTSLTKPANPASPSTGTRGSRRMPAPTRSAYAPVTAASSPVPTPAPAAAPTAWRTFAGPCVRTPTWRSTRFHSAEPSMRRRRRPASPMRNLPNAGKFQQTNDPSCSCRRRGQELGGRARQRGGEVRPREHDILVTPEKSAEMARPIVDPKAKLAMDAKVKPAKPLAHSPAAAPGVQPGAPPPVDQTTPGPRRQRRRHQTRRGNRNHQPGGVRHRRWRRARAATFSVKPGQTVEVRGPDGVTRSVRIVGPTL